MKIQPFSQAKFLVAEAAFGMIYGLSMIWLISRVRGEDFLGQYAVFTTWAAMFQIAAHLGIADLILREMGKDPKRSGVFISCGTFLCFISSIIAMGAMVILVHLFNYPLDVQNALLLSCLTIFPSTLAGLLKSGFIAEKKLQIYFFIFLPETLVLLTLNGYFILNGYGLITIVKTVLFTKIASSLLSLFILNRWLFPIKWKIDLDIIRPLLGPLFSFSMVGISILVFWRIDIVMLSKMTTMAVTGIYVTASKFLEVFSVLPSSFAQTIFPQLSRQFKEQTIEKQNLEDTIQKLYFLVAPISICVFLFAHPLLTMVFGERFAPAALALQIFMITFLILTADMVMAITCQAAGYQKMHMYFSLINIPTNITLNFLLIPKIGLVGASLATMISISVSCLLHFYFISLKLLRLNWLRIVIKPLAIGLILAVPMILLKNKFHFIFLSITYVLFYCLICKSYFSKEPQLIKELK